jgi:hypothetical protein
MYGVTLLLFFLTYSGVRVHWQGKGSPPKRMQQPVETHLPTICLLFSFSRLFPSRHPPRVVDNVMDEHINTPRSVEPNMGNLTIQESRHRTLGCDKTGQVDQQVLDPPLHPDDAEKIIETRIDERAFGRCWRPELHSSCWPKVSPVQLSRVSYYLSYHIQSIRPS